MLLAAIAAALVVCAWLGPLEPPAQRHIDAGLERALLSYATARALNAVISVAQGTEVAVQPAGVGVVLAPGQALEPINDLIEQFANLMLTASVAFGVQKVLLAVGAHWLVSAALTLAALGWTAVHLRRHAPPAWLSRLLLVLLMIRFALPVVVIGSDLLFERFMADDYRTSQQAIEAASLRLDQLDPPSVGAEPESTRVLSQIKRVIRTNYSNPPTHGGAVVAAVLSNPELRQTWELELKNMRERIRAMRLSLVDKLKAQGTKQDFSFIVAQRGMFSYTGLSAEQVARLQSEYAIYAVNTGRICLAALNTHNIDYVAKAIAEVL